MMQSGVIRGPGTDGFAEGRGSDGEGIFGGIGGDRAAGGPDVTASAVRIRIDESLAKPFLSHIALYQDDIYQ